MNIIETVDLTKEFKIFNSREGLSGALKDLIQRDYRLFSAVKNLNLEVKKGEILGFIGVNGAGKSTTIKMLTGILVPTSGKVIVNGFVPHKQRREYTRGIGVVFGQRSQLWWDLAVIESFRLLGKVYQVEPQVLDQRINHFREMLELDGFLHQPVRKLSLGQKMRCELAAAFLHNPPLVFLDEPTIGLDLIAKNSIREFLKEINKSQGTTIFLTTHDIGDIEALCTRLIIIDAGKSLYDGTIEELRCNYGSEGVVQLELGEKADKNEFEKHFADFPISWKQQSSTKWQGTYIRSEINLSNLLSHLLIRYSVYDMSFKETSVEDIVRKIYAGEMRADECDR